MKFNQFPQKLPTIQSQSWKTDSLAVVVGNNSRWWSVESGGGSCAEDNRSDEDKSANVMVVGPSLAEVAQLKK